MNVISYTRFSSKRQAKGDSYRRQTDMSAKWCQENGYELDTILRYEDLGVSAWSGASTEIGAFSTHFFVMYPVSNLPNVLRRSVVETLRRAAQQACQGQGKELGFESAV